MLFRAILVSQTVLPAYGPADREIARRAEQKNKQIGISGFLHREYSQFCQVLEGDAPAISILIDQQARDRRHFGLNVIQSGPIRQRAFDSWAMGYSPETEQTLACWHGAPAGTILAARDLIPDIVLGFLKMRSAALSCKLLAQGSNAHGSNTMASHGQGSHGPESLGQQNHSRWRSAS